MEWGWRSIRDQEGVQGMGVDIVVSSADPSVPISTNIKYKPITSPFIGRKSERDQKREGKKEVAKKDCFVI